MPLRLTAILVAALIVVPAATVAEDDPPKLRRHEDGPLTKKDFASEAPSPRPVSNGVRLTAVVHTEIRYAYRYRYVNEDEGVTVTLTKLDVFALVLPEKSWNATPEDGALLDHEQGHFDIGAVHAAMARKKLSAVMERGDLKSTGKDLETAKRAVVKKVDAVMKDVTDAARREDRRYDDETRHGADRVAQAKHRQHHRRLMEQFEVSKDKPAR